MHSRLAFTRGRTALKTVQPAHHIAFVDIVGEQIVEWFIRLRDAGCDGLQVNFYDFLPDLEFFGEEVLPLMIERVTLNTRRKHAHRVEIRVLASHDRRSRARFRQKVTC